MKARVIKEWEMYGITHKVGDVMDIPLHSPGGLPMISDRDAFLLDNGFIEEMKEPLIKDEKIRKAVRAWADANRVTEARYSSCHDAECEFNARDDGNKSIVFIGDFTEINKELDYSGRTIYTIDELCGEKEE